MTEDELHRLKALHNDLGELKTKYHLGQQENLDVLMAQNVINRICVREYDWRNPPKRRAV